MFFFSHMFFTTFLASIFNRLYRKLEFFMTLIFFFSKLSKKNHLQKFILWYVNNFIDYDILFSGFTKPSSLRLDFTSFAPESIESLALKTADVTGL